MSQLDCSYPIKQFFLLNNIPTSLFKYSLLFIFLLSKNMPQSFQNTHSFIKWIIRSALSYPIHNYSSLIPIPRSLFILLKYNPMCLKSSFNSFHPIPFRSTPPSDPIHLRSLESSSLNLFPCVQDSLETMISSFLHTLSISASHSQIYLVS